MQKLIKAFSLLWFAGALGVFTVLLIWGRLILEILFGPDFVSAWGATRSLAFGYLMSCLFGMAAIVLNKMGDAKTTAKLFTAEAAMNILFNLLLILLFGHIGAALALVVTTIGWKCSAVWIFYRR